MLSLKPETSSTMLVLFVGIIIPTSHIVFFLRSCVITMSRTSSDLNSVQWKHKDKLFSCPALNVKLNEDVRILLLYSLCHRAQKPSRCPLSAVITHVLRPFGSGTLWFRGHGYLAADGENGTWMPLSSSSQLPLTRLNTSKRNVTLPFHPV